MSSDLMCGECQHFVDFMDVIKPGTSGPFTEDIFFNPCKKGKTVCSFDRACELFFTNQHIASGLPRVKRVKPRVKRTKILVQF